MALLRALGRLQDACSGSGMQALIRPMLASTQQASSAVERGLHASSSHSSSDWTSHANTQFSLQPSYFSPLYSTYKQQVEQDLRRQLAASLLRAHKELANQAAGLDQAQVAATSLYRIEEIRRSAEELRALGDRSSTVQCISMDQALGFYSILEEQSAGADMDAEAFHAVTQGQESVWAHWKKHFAAQYAASPGMEPLHTVYSRPQAGVSREPHATGEEVSGSKQHAGSTTHGGLLDKYGLPNIDMRGRPTLDSRGVARAAGSRKSSEADVRLAPGTGHIYINEKPYDEFLRDVSIRLHVLQPFLISGTMGQYDVVATVSGGGPSSMAQAVQHGIAKALLVRLKLPGAQAGQASMRLRSLARWDPRQVERKKPGRKKARKGFAYVRR